MRLVHDPDFELHVGDALETLTTLPSGSVDCVVTSPPYWGLRDYGTGLWEGGDPDCAHRVREEARIESSTLGGGKAAVGHQREGFKDSCPRCGATRTDNQLGLEASPDEYVARMVELFREVRRVLAPHGTLWLNLGDSFNAYNGGRGPSGSHSAAADEARPEPQRGLVAPELKPKDLCGIPWRVALALQADGWYLRSDIVWSKPNPMPESVTDRPTKSHEYVFLLSKGPRYFFDQEAVREQGQDWSSGGPGTGILPTEHYGAGNGGNGGLSDLAQRYKDGTQGAGRNVRSVWEIATRPFSEAHFATYPPELVRRCLLAGCPERVCETCGKPSERIMERTTFSQRSIATKRQEPGALRHDGDRNLGGQQFNKFKDANPDQFVGWSDCGHNAWRPGTVLDPFLGSGTTALVAREHGRRCVGIELNPGYAEMAARRLGQLSLLADAHG